MLFHLCMFLVIMLSFEMMCYNVYVPLFLRLSNYIKENPGPTIYAIVNSNNTVRADFNQGNQAKFGGNASKQCVAMSLTAIIPSPGTKAAQKVSFNFKAKQLTWDY